MEGSTHWRRNPKIKSIYMSIHSWRVHEIEEAPTRSTVHEGQTCSLVRKCALSILQSSQITSETTFSKVSTASSEIKFTLVIPCPILSQDRDGADFFKDVQMMVDQLGTNPVPIQLPIGKAATFKGVYDLVEMRSIIWTGEESVYREVGTLEVIKPYIFTRHIPSVDCLRTTGVRMRKRNIRKIPRHSLRPVFPDFNRFLMM